MKWRLLGAGGGVLGPFSAKYGSSFLKFRPEVGYHKTKTVYEQFFKIKCLSRNGTHPKFGPNLPLGKPKHCQKTKFFQKLHPYGYQITQDKSQNSSKINKKTHFLGQNHRPVIKDQEVRGQVSTIF